MSITPLTPSRFARGRVTWVKSQWKSSAEPGQLSLEINKQGTLLQTPAPQQLAELEEAADGTKGWRIMNWRVQSDLAA